jgi:tetratricopeptide (TPR) repeat protein
MKLPALIIATALTLVSCANPINLRTAHNYAQGCVGFQHQGEWWKARQACGRAAINAELGGAEPQAIASLWYEYGRTSGVICDYPEAKKALEKSLQSDKENNGPIIMDYFELARLHFDQKLYKDASAYYQSGVAATPKETIAQDPIGYAEVLDEYGEALQQIGNAKESEKVIAESKQLRSSNPNVKSLTKRTPYGKFCDQKS